MSFKNHVLCTAEVIIPQIQGNELLKERFWQSFSSFYNDLDAESASKLKLLGKVINMLAIFTTLKSLGGQSLKQREVFLKKTYHSPIKLVSAGFTGLRSLILVSFYGMQENWASLNYEGPLVNR